MKQLLISILFCSLVLSVFGQQNPLLPKYGFNSLLYNPAYVGARHHPFLSISGLQSLDDGSSNFYNVSFNTPLNNPHHAIGLSLMSDRAGIFQQQLFNIAYAYRFYFKKGKFNESILSIGFNGSVTNWKADWDIVFADYPNFRATNLGVSRRDPNFGIGLMYYNRFGYTGISVPYITNHSIGNIVRNGPSNYFPKQSRHIMVMAGRIVPILVYKDYFLKPSFVFRYSELHEFLKDDALEDFLIPEMELETELAFIINKKWEFGTALKMFFKYDYVIEGCDIWIGNQLKNGLKIRVIYNHSIRQEVNRSVEMALLYDWYKNAKIIPTQFY